MVIAREAEAGSRVLTARQRDVALLVARRYLQKEIAAELGISEKAVQKHVQAIKQRLGANSLREIAELLRREVEMVEGGENPTAPKTRLSASPAPWPNSSLDEPYVLNEAPKAVNLMPSSDFAAMPRFIPRLLDGKHRVAVRLALIALMILAVLFAIIFAVSAIVGLSELVRGTTPDLVLQKRQVGSVAGADSGVPGMNRTMLNDRDAIRAGLRQTEGAFDEALLETTSLMQRMIRARQNPDVAVHEGQTAIIRLSRVVQRTVAASSEVFRVHDEMSRVGIAYGVLDEDGSTPLSGLENVPFDGIKADEAA